MKERRIRIVIEFDSAATDETIVKAAKSIQHDVLSFGDSLTTYGCEIDVEEIGDKRVVRLE